jgi:hypothetical protein
MEGYLGETPVDVATDPAYAGWEPRDWALLYITRYGQIGGDHHKAWVLDQVARILQGTPVIVTEARWANGETERRVRTGEPTENYTIWVEDMLGEDYGDGEREYTYDVGIPP